MKSNNIIYFYENNVIVRFNDNIYYLKLNENILNNGIILNKDKFIKKYNEFTRKRVEKSISAVVRGWFLHKIMIICTWESKTEKEYVRTQRRCKGV